MPPRLPLEVIIEDTSREDDACDMKADILQIPAGQLQQSMPAVTTSSICRGVRMTSHQRCRANEHPERIAWHESIKLHGRARAATAGTLGPPLPLYTMLAFFFKTISATAVSLRGIVCKHVLNARLHSTSKLAADSQPSVGDVLLCSSTRAGEAGLAQILCQAWLSCISASSLCCTIGVVGSVFLGKTQKADDVAMTGLRVYKHCA